MNRLKRGYAKFTEIINQVSDCRITVLARIDKMKKIGYNREKR